MSAELETNGNTENFGTVLCSVAVLEDGRVMFVPQDALFRTRLETFQEGTSVARWDDPVAGPSGAVYNPLFVIFEAEGSRIAAALVPPTEARPFLETDEATRAIILLSESDSPDDELLLTNSIDFDLPPLPQTKN